MIKALTARIKNFIILNSGRDQPKEIEEAYAKVAPVKEMCVFAVSEMKGVKGSKVLWAVIQPDLDAFGNSAK